jgi:hypothetical protein
MDHPPMPVIYGVFNNIDTVHYIRVGKTFGAATDPRISARLYDSLYFDEMESKVKVFVDRTPYKLELVDDIPKEPGLFHSPDQRLYRFQTQKFYRWSNIEIRVDIQGLPEASGKVYAVEIGRLTTPKKGQQTIYMVPTSPFRVIWSGNPWNEIDVAFEFRKEMHDSTFQSEWVHIENKTYFESAHDNYREMSISYEEFIRETLLQIAPNDSVFQIFFGRISISIHGGDQNMVQYMKYLNGYNDFNIDEFSNIENGFGLMASRATYTLDSLYFDYQSRQALIHENRLKVLKISPWN